MTSPIPVIIVASGERPALESRLAAFGAFPIVHAGWDEAAQAITKVEPGAVVADVDGMPADALNAVADACATMPIYTPLITVGCVECVEDMPSNALPFAMAELHALDGRLSCALRVRTLHAAVLRRLDDQSTLVKLPDHEPLKDATVLLVGRGRSYPPLSVAVGECTVLIGALTIEAAAKHLNTRDIDGIVLGDGFSHRVALAFLSVLSEDTRFRSLPVIVAGSFAGGPVPELPNLEIVRGSPEQVAAHMVPLVRQRAFEMRLSHTLKAIDADGQIDPMTGLLTSGAFDSDWDKAVTETLANGGALSAARFSFEGATARTSRDAARILARLMRSADFASLRNDDSIIAAFAETDLRTAHVIARRLASVLRQTAVGPGNARLDPMVTLATVKPTDTAVAVIERLGQVERAAS